jgi:mannitol/fructose-specific phosphotransferase system IIA component (Ntr-type)
MAEILDERELVSFKEMLMTYSIQVDALAQLLIEKGIITEEEFFAKLKQVQNEYQSKGGEKVIDEAVVYSANSSTTSRFFLTR